MPPLPRSTLVVSVVGLGAAAALLLAWSGRAPLAAAPSAASTDAGAIAGHGDAGDPPPCALGAEACAGPDGHAARAADGRPPVAMPSVPGAPQLIEFEAAYCAACATMAPVVTSIVQSCARASDVVRRVDVARTEGEALAEHYRVDALPTFLAVDAEGHEVFRRVGVQKPAELAALVAEVSGEDCSATN